jgi:hypothetical protein
MAALAGLIAHGGLAGALAEGLVAVAVAGILVAVWLRERRRGDEDDRGGAGLREDDEG